jgi:hypothetical protein
MSRARLLLLAVPIALLAAPVLAAGPGEIAQETQRSVAGASGVFQVWWLPSEYWEAAAKRQSWPEEQLKALEGRIRNYLVLGVIDATLGGTKLSFAEHADIAEQIAVERNGTAIKPLRQLDPSLAKMIPELSYFIRISLGPLQEGLRLLFFPNLSDAGETILTGSGAGELRVGYRPEGAAEPVDFRWRGPLTSVAGRRTCPEGGEPLEASWRFCPWHGVELGSGSQAD